MGTQHQPHDHLVECAFVKFKRMLVLSLNGLSSQVKVTSLGAHKMASIPLNAEVIILTPSRADRE
jgi:hypothetical protein